MHFAEEKRSRNHVINKIKRISVAIDREEFWNYLMLTGLFSVLAGALVYYLLL